MHQENNHLSATNQIEHCVQLNFRVDLNFGQISLAYEARDEKEV